MILAPGTYYLTDTWSCRDLTFFTIQGHNAIIKAKAGANFSDKALIDFTGTGYLSVFALRVSSDLTTGAPAVGVLLGRSDTLDGGSDRFYSCGVYGKFTVAGILNVCSELPVFTGLNMESNNASPCLIDSDADVWGFGLRASSNVRKHFFGCNFIAADATCETVIDLPDAQSELTFRDCYFYSPCPTGRIFYTHDADGSHACDGLTLDNCRVEAADGVRLLVNTKQLNRLRIRRLAWFPTSDYLILSSRTIRFADVELSDLNEINTTKVAHMTGGYLINSKLEVPAESIQVEDTAQALWNTFVCTGGFPLTGNPGAIDELENVVVTVGNLAAGFDSAITVQRVRNKLKIIDNTSPAPSAPSVKGYSLFNFEHLSATNLTDLPDPTPGQEVTICFRTGNVTVVHGTKFMLAGSANWNAPAKASLRLVWNEREGWWNEIARTVP